MTYTPTPEAIEAAAVAMFYGQNGIAPPYPLWEGAGPDENGSYRDLANLALTAAAPVIAAQAKGEALAPILALHKPEKRWTTPDYTGSFDTREEAADLDESDDGPNVDYFEICQECGRIERNWAENHAETMNYELASWPCKTAAAVLP